MVSVDFHVDFRLSGFTVDCSAIYLKNPLFIRAVRVDSVEYLDGICVVYQADGGVDMFSVRPGSFDVDRFLCDDPDEAYRYVRHTLVKLGMPRRMFRKVCDFARLSLVVNW